MAEPSNSLSLVISSGAAALSIASILLNFWKLWRDRPRLVFFVACVNMRWSDKQTIDMLQIKVANTGYRPIVIVRLMALGRKSQMSFGIHDEPDAALGTQNQIFPAIVESGKTLTFHAMPIDSLAQNGTDPKVFHDPWMYFIFIDSFGRFYHMRVADVRWRLNLDRKWVPLSRWENMAEYFLRRYMFFKLKRRLKLAATRKFRAI